MLSDTHAMTLHQEIQKKMEIVQPKFLWRVKKREKHERADMEGRHL